MRSSGAGFPRPPELLERGPLGLLEPPPPYLGPDALARARLVLVPALAVDRQGNRLGRGRGYYDRALAELPAAVRVLAVVFDDELLDDVPTEAHDRPVTGALLPSGAVMFSADAPGTPLLDSSSPAGRTAGTRRSNDMSSARETLNEETTKAKRAANRVDDFQQRHPAFGFPIAVWRKFSEDQAGNLAALIAYWAFFSIFPLLLVAVTVIGLVGVGPGTFKDVMTPVPAGRREPQGLSGNVVGPHRRHRHCAVERACGGQGDPDRVRLGVGGADARAAVVLRQAVSGLKALVVIGIGMVLSLGLAGIATGGKKMHVSLPDVAALVVGRRDRSR